MEFHPVTKLFPPLDADRQKNLERDLKENGLHDAIWIYDGMVLDGRARYLACQSTGTIPRFRLYTGDPKKIPWFLLMMNAGRCLTDDQRAVLAVKLVDMFNGTSRTIKIKVAKILQLRD